MSRRRYNPFRGDEDKENIGPRGPKRLKTSRDLFCTNGLPQSKRSAPLESPQLRKKQCIARKEEVAPCIQATTIQDLPEEVLMHIFEFLHFCERREARKVNRTWRSVLNNARFNKREIYRFKYCYLPSFVPSFQQLDCPMWNVEIGEEVCFNRPAALKAFLSHIGAQTRRLVVSFGPEDIGRFRGMMHYFPKLEEVEFTGDDIDLSDFFNQKFFLKSNLKSLKRMHVPQMCGPLDDEDWLFLKSQLNILTADKVAVWSFVGGPHFRMQREFQNFVTQNFDIFEIIMLKAPGCNLLSSEGLSCRDVHCFYSNLVDFGDVHISAIGLKPLSSLGLFENLTELHLGVRMGVNNHRRCFFVHQSPALPKVKVVKLAKTYLIRHLSSCSQCFSSLLASCQNATTWHLANIRMLNMMDEQKILENLEVLALFNCQIPLTFFTRNPFPQTSFKKLRSLVVGVMDNYSREEWQNWPGMPSLKELKMSFSDFINGGLPEVVMLQSNTAMQRLQICIANVFGHTVQTLAKWKIPGVVRAGPTERIKFLTRTLAPPETGIFVEEVLLIEDSSDEDI